MSFNTMTFLDKPITGILSYLPSRVCAMRNGILNYAIKKTFKITVIYIGDLTIDAALKTIQTVEDNNR